MNYKFCRWLREQVIGFPIRNIKQAMIALQGMADIKVH